MSVHFYAGYWQFGVGVGDFDGNPICSLLVFDSRKERDAWVDADHFDNNWHRSALTRGEALPFMRGELDVFRAYNSRGFEGWRVNGLFYTSIGDAFKAFYDGEVAAHRRAGCC